MNAIEMEHVCKRYRDFALEDLSLTLPGGCIMGLVGENGAGKSTTFRLLLNMARRDGGRIALLGRSADGDPRDLRELREEIGVVLDGVNLPACMNAAEVGRVMSRCYRSWDAAAYADWLGRLELPQNKKYGDFSRGMKMKLCIATALSHHPRLLLLDEATAGLDPVIRDEILDIFSDFARDEEHSVLLSSHIVSDLEKICDYVAFLHKGRLLLCEEKDRLREEYALVRGTPEELGALPPEALVGKKVTSYGAEAIVRRAEVPRGMAAGPVDLEQVFIFMAREGKAV